MISKRARNQRGFTLIEILVSILISTIMMGVALTQLIGSRTLFNIQESNSRIEENGRYALDMLSSHIRMANFADSRDNNVSLPEGSFFTSSCAALNPCTADGASDRIAIWTNPSSAENQEFACDGTALADTASSIANVFYVSGNALVCRTFSVSSAGIATAVTDQQTIINGIENMQVLYGLTDGTEKSEIPVRYVSADTVNAFSGPFYTNWGSISSVRLSILAGTGLDIETNDESDKSYTLADVTLPFSDGNRRKVFTTTVVINNAQQ
jgi:type IV pilus assembly protein PilW